MFHCRSISHHHTPLALREQLSLTTHQQQQWLAQRANTEAIILSTCNRLELYAHVPTVKQMDRLWSDLLHHRQVSAQAIAPHTMSFTDFDAVHHLFRVSCGLESMALGEPQILGQVTHAYEQAHEAQRAGGMLSLLFRSAIHAAKRARTETAISTGSASVSSLGIAKAEGALGPLDRHQILVIGAGEMAQTIVKALDQRGVKQVTIVSRTYDNARRLAEEWEVQARPITELRQAIMDADVLFTTSSAPFTILSREDLDPIMAQRPDRTLCVVDIAVPRDVEPSVAEVPGICLHDLDDLEQVIEVSLSERQQEIPAVEQIIQYELDTFWKDYQARTVVPTIRQIREHAEELRQAELSRIYNRLPAESAHEKALFDQFSHRFMNKILHDVTLNLKERATQDDGALFAAVARDLFGLEDNTSDVPY